MVIQLSDNIRISGDPLNFAVEEYKIPKKADKNPYWTVVGYYPKLHMALDRAAQHITGTSELTTVQELKDLLVEIKEQIAKVAP